MAQTKIKEYKDCIIRFDDFDYHFYTMLNNETIKDKDLEKLLQKIDRIKKIKQANIEAYGRIDNQIIRMGDIVITSVNNVSGKVYYTITDNGKKIKKQDYITWCKLFKKNEINKNKIDEINKITNEIESLKVKRSNLLSELETIDLTAIGG